MMKSMMTRCPTLPPLPPSSQKDKGMTANVRDDDDEMVIVGYYYDTINESITSDISHAGMCYRDG